MSRPIKFRAWDKDRKEFVYISETDEGFWINDGISTTVMPNHTSNLEQYTGLTDKDGKEIYEGDIIKARDWDGDWGKYRMKWKQSHCAFEAFEYRKSGAWNWTLKGFVDIEVIGNIHENPELLEGEK